MEVPRNDFFTDYSRRGRVVESATVHSHGPQRVLAWCGSVPRWLEETCSAAFSGAANVQSGYSTP